MVHILVLAGGVGSRLWPVSTPKKPKQFLKLVSDSETLLQSTVKRYTAVLPQSKVWVSSNQEYTDYIRKQVPEAQILSEPVGRNTAPAIRFAVEEIYKEDPKARVVITPADAYVGSSIETAILNALEVSDFLKSITCIGIRPSRPSTEYGYIKYLDSDEVSKTYEVQQFVEKPNEEKAIEYIKNGYLWNAGIFISTAQTFLDSFKTFCPEVYSAVSFEDSPKISFDYAVLEKCTYTRVCPVDWDWSDLGSFEAIEKITGKPVTKERYLFIGIDGVLNYEDHYAELLKSQIKFDERKPYLRDFNAECVKRVNQIIEDTGATLVITSSWRLDSNLNKILKDVGLLNAFEKTPFCWGRPRGEEISMFLNNKEYLSYCIIDDYWDMLEEQKPYFIQVNESLQGDQGLSERVKERAIDILLNNGKV